MSVGSEESWDHGTAGDGDDVGLSGSSAVELGETVGSSGGGIEAPLEWYLTPAAAISLEETYSCLYW